ncbi:MAG: lactate utilization protein C [Betaproteobacteria bacterium]|nr:lactate utilization protein C [Betaproteobacteria bacterium]
MSSGRGTVGARENILARIRKAQGRGGPEPTAAELAQVRETIARHEIGPQPAFAHAPDRLAQFRRECERLGTTHATVASERDIPAEIARYLGAGGLEPRVVGWPEFASLDWNGAGIAFENRPAGGDDRTGLTGCFCAIAETGTTLLLSSPETPKVTALLPETHLCIVRKDRVLDTMEDSFALLRKEVGEPPRSVFFVSGPSRTADIEQTIVIGAHGPYRVHIIIA